MPLPEPAPADTTPPAAPTLTASDLESAAITGTTLHYRAGGNGGFTVTAAAGADVARVDFSALGAGWFGGGSDATAPFTAAYGFSLASVAPFPLTAVASDAAGNASAPARLNVVGDGAGPTVTLTCEPDECTGQISLSAADGGSGVARLVYSVDGSEPTTPYEGTPFLATTEMPLRARAVDRVGNVGPELARNVGPPPTQFEFTFGEGVNAAGDDTSQTAWTRPGVAGSLRVTASDLEVEWPDLGAGWTVERDLDTAVYSFSATAAAPLIVPVDAGARRSFFRLRHDGTQPSAPAIACACDQHSTVGVEIALSATDADSGVDRILYSLDGTEPSIAYSGPFKAYASGTLRTRAVDRVGNPRPSRHARARHRRLRRSHRTGAHVAAHGRRRDRGARGHRLLHPGLAPALHARGDRGGSGVRDRRDRLSGHPGLDAHRRHLRARTVSRGVRPARRAGDEPRRADERGELQDRDRLSLRASLIACSSRSRARISVKRSLPCSG